MISSSVLFFKLEGKVTDVGRPCVSRDDAGGAAVPEEVFGVSGAAALLAASPAAWLGMLKSDFAGSASELAGGADAAVLANEALPVGGTEGAVAGEGAAGCKLEPAPKSGVWAAPDDGRGAAAFPKEEEEVKEKALGGPLAADPGAAVAGLAPNRLLPLVAGAGGAPPNNAAG